MLHSIFPTIARIPNKMGPGSALTSAEMICFFLFCGFTLLACQLSMWVRLGRRYPGRTNPPHLTQSQVANLDQRQARRLCHLGCWPSCHHAQAGGWNWRHPSRAFHAAWVRTSLDNRSLLPSRSSRLLDVCFQRHRLSTQLGDGQQPDPRSGIGVSHIQLYRHPDRYDCGILFKEGIRGGT